MAALLGYVLQSNVDQLHHIGIDGVFVPDTVALRNTVEVYWWLQPPIDSTWQPIIGVMRLYWAGLLWGSWAICVVNIGLMFVATYYFLKLLRLVLTDESAFLKIAATVLLLIAANVYLIEVMAFPNKEIPLLAISNAYMYYLFVRKSYAGAVLISLIAFIFRDGYGVILLICAGLVWLLSNQSRNMRILVLGILLAMLAFIPISLFVELGNVISRNTALGTQSSTTYGVVTYFQHLKYNLVSLSMLNSFVTNKDSLYLLNIGYWQLGVLVLTGASWAIRQILFEDNQLDVGIAIVIVVAILAISYSSFIQPRYLMPLMYFLALGCVRHIRTSVTILLIALITPTLLFLGGYLPKIAITQQYSSWSW
ncbi:MAG: hypothetical protein PXX73_01610 [Sideroxydans sp.]|nr:hypothetical protein [Sideroxydans sp.]